MARRMSIRKAAIAGILDAICGFRAIAAFIVDAVLIPLQVLWFFATMLVAAACGAIGYGGYCIYQAAHEWLEKQRKKSFTRSEDELRARLPLPDNGHVNACYVDGMREIVEYDILRCECKARHDWIDQDGNRITYIHGPIAFDPIIFDRVSHFQKVREMTRAAAKRHRDSMLARSPS